MYRYSCNKWVYSDAIYYMLWRLTFKPVFKEIVKVLVVAVSRKISACIIFIKISWEFAEKSTKIIHHG